LAKEEMQVERMPRHSLAKILKHGVSLTLLSQRAVTICPRRLHNTGLSQ